MAGGSQIIISSDGITIKTPNEFKVFAGQHKFESGQKVTYELPLLPRLGIDIDKKSMRFDLSELDVLSSFSDSKYRVYKSNGSFHEGILDSRGRSQRIFTEESEELELFVDHSDFVVEEEFFVESSDDQEN